MKKYMGKEEIVIDVIRKMSSSTGRLVPIEDIRKNLKGFMSSKDLEVCLQNLEERDELVRPSKKFIEVLDED